MPNIESIGARFQDSGNTHRESESFHGMLFSNLDLTSAAEPISFFRSDFRQVKIENVKFFKNNFDRADFVDAYLRNSSFSECQFGTDFLNTYFDSIRFEKNREDTCTASQCIYHKCTFKGEVFRNSTIRECRFLSCRFEDCVFEMNTADTLSFEDSEFHGIDFSNMTALNFAFANCRFYELRIDPDYLGTYLFKGSTPEGLSYSYRGEDLHSEADFLESIQSMMGAYARSNRIFEAFNSAILYNSFAKKGKSLQPIFKWAIENIANEPTIRRKNSFLKIVSALAFYSDSDVISPNDLLYVIQALFESDLTSFGLTDRLELESRFSFLRELVKERMLAPGTPWQSGEGYIHFEVVADEDQKKMVEDGVGNFFDALSESLGDTGFQILNVRRGSLIFECVAALAAVTAFASCLRQVSSNIIRITLEFRLSTKYI